MKILVTGASGFIGGRFARFALEQGLSVRVNGRRAEGVEHLVRRGAEFIQGDLRSGACARLCDDIEAVVHCAGAVGTWGRRQDFHQGNVQVTENVVEACLKQRVRRLVHLSSPSIYFDGRSHLDIREEQVPKRFGNHYAATKYLAEQKVFGAEEFGLEVIALRPRFVTGAGDTSIFPRLLQMQQKRRLSIIGNGLNKVDFTSIQNLNEACSAVCWPQGQHWVRLTTSVTARRCRSGTWSITSCARWNAAGKALSLVRPGVQRRSLNEAACLIWPGQPEPTLSRHGDAGDEQKFHP